MKLVLTCKLIAQSKDELMGLGPLSRQFIEMVRAGIAQYGFAEVPPNNIELRFLVQGVVWDDSPVRVPVTIPEPDPVQCD